MEKARDWGLRGLPPRRSRVLILDGRLPASGGAAGEIVRLEGRSEPGPCLCNLGA